MFPIRNAIRGLQFGAGGGGLGVRLMKTGSKVSFFPAASIQLSAYVKHEQDMKFNLVLATCIC
jgi:hypothetical protein